MCNITLIYGRIAEILKLGNQGRRWGRYHVPQNVFLVLFKDRRVQELSEANSRSKRYCWKIIVQWFHRNLVHWEKKDICCGHTKNPRNDLLYASEATKKKVVRQNAHESVSHSLMASFSDLSAPVWYWGLSTHTVNIDVASSFAAATTILVAVCHKQVSRHCDGSVVCDVRYHVVPCSSQV